LRDHVPTNGSLIVTSCAQVYAGPWAAVLKDRLRFG
jgi:hypothetical protein